MFETLFLISFLPLFVFALIAILNALTFPRLKAVKPIADFPLVSVLIPMRNESLIIAGTVTSLLAQDYPNLEVILLDDHSNDSTFETALQSAQGDRRITILRGEALPNHWLGKVWACHQLSTHASGEYLLFADADVQWESNAISALVSESMRTNADLLNAWTTQITRTWGERLIVPLMGFSIHAYLPVLATHHLPWKIFAAASGQCLLFRREAYKTIGGHAAIKNNILDDMSLAYAIKEKHLRFRSVDANGMIHTRMYSNWEQVRNGYAKNILAGHGNSILLLLISTIFHWWQFILPMVCLFVSIFFPRIFPNTIYFFLLTALGIITRALTAASTHQRIVDAFLMPVSVLMMTVIAIQSIRWHYTGEVQWKGRKLNTNAS